MTAKQPTVRSLAIELGLSRATVAGALRGSPGFRPETIQRVCDAAHAAGYRHNPLAGAVMSELRRSRLQQFRGVLAVVDLDAGERTVVANYFNRMLTLGAQRRARELGFELQLYTAGKKGVTINRLDSILQARGIQGICVVPSKTDPDLSKLDWSRYAGVYLDYFINLPAINSVCTDHSRAMIDVLDRVRRSGYRRPGLFLPDYLDRRIQFRWSGAFLGYQRNHPEIGDVPLLVANELSAKNFRRWFMRHRPDVVLGHQTAVVDWMKESGASIPERHGFVCLNVAKLDRPCAGVDLQPDLLGAKGLELLIAQVQRGEMGIPEHPSITSIPARWQDGPTVRGEERRLPDFR